MGSVKRRRDAEGRQPAKPKRSGIQGGDTPVDIYFKID